MLSFAVSLSALQPIGPLELLQEDGSRSILFYNHSSHSMGVHRLLSGSSHALFSFNCEFHHQFCANFSENLPLLRTFYRRDPELPLEMVGADFFGDAELQVSLFLETAQDPTFVEHVADVEALHRRMNARPDQAYFVVQGPDAREAEALCYRAKEFAAMFFVEAPLFRVSAFRPMEIQFEGDASQLFDFFDQHCLPAFQQITERNLALYEGRFLLLFVYDMENETQRALGAQFKQFAASHVQRNSELGQVFQFGYSPLQAKLLSDNDFTDANQHQFVAMALHEQPIYETYAGKLGGLEAFALDFFFQDDLLKDEL